VSILYHRIKRGLSQEKLAEAIGVPELRILNYEKGRLFPDPQFEKKVAEFFGVPVSEMKREIRWPRLTKEGTVKGLTATQTRAYLRGLLKYLDPTKKPVLPIAKTDKRRERKNARKGEGRCGSVGELCNGSEGNGGIPEKSGRSDDKDPDAGSGGTQKRPRTVADNQGIS